MARVRIIVLNYNGTELLGKCLPSLIQAAKQASTPSIVSVIDNCSADESVSLIKQEFPEVDLWLAPENRVLCSYNDYLKTITEPIVILLNNDIRVEPNFINPLVERFESDPQAFLVAPKVMSFDGSRVEAGRSRARMRFGLFECNARFPGYESEVNKPSETFSSGFGAFSREIFLSLQGYDPRFLPGIMEDVDLCYRARRAGYSLYYEPRSVVYHIGQASFKKTYGSMKTSILAHRNNFLFMWKNFSNLTFWISHIFFLPLRLVFALIRGKVALLMGFFQALTTTKKT